MARQEVDIGVEGNDGTGDSIRESFRKVNSNFQEIYAVVGKGGQITFTLLEDTPDSLDPYQGNGQAAYIPIVKQDGSGIEVRKLISNSEASDGTQNDTVTFDVSQDGKVILRTVNSRLQQDSAPALGGPLDASSVAIANIDTSQTAIDDWNTIHGDNLTVDDLVIDKKFADRNYIARQLPGEKVNLPSEPDNDSGYTKTLSIDTTRAIITEHGFTAASIGDDWIYESAGTPANYSYTETQPGTGAKVEITGTLSNGDSVYIRPIDDNTVEFYLNQADAQQQDDVLREELRLKLTGGSGTQTIRNAAYDSTLEGFFLDNEALPRKSAVRRQGDSMEGALFLNDHPGNLAGAGIPNGENDLQAVTKLYVDSQSTESSVNIFVSTNGDDAQPLAPAGKEGSSLAYAYSSIGAACRKAEEIQIAAPFEPGPYMQDIIYSELVASDEPPVVSKSQITSANVDNATPGDLDVKSLIDVNKEFVVAETLAWINDKISNNETTTVGSVQLDWSEVVYNELVLEEDLIKIIDATILDHVSGTIVNVLSNRAGIEYFADPTSKSEAGLSREVFLTAVDRARTIILNVLENDPAFPYSSLQDIYDQVFLTGLTTETVSGTPEEVPLDDDISSINDNYNTVIDIVRDGVFSAGIDRTGNRYKIEFTNGNNNFVDQGNPENNDLRVGKVIRGKTSGAIGRIVSYTQGNTADDSAELELLTPKEFINGENLEFGNTIKSKQISIRVETGTYFEDYPIRVPGNVSIKGDEFRRCIIRPIRRTSQSPWANIYFYRDLEFDGLRGDSNSVTGIADPNIPASGTAYINPLTGEQDGWFGRHYLNDPLRDKNVDNNGNLTVLNIGNFFDSSRLIEKNKDFITEEVVAWIAERVDRSSPPSGFTTITFDATKKDKYRRTIGSMIETLVADLRQGGKLNTLGFQGDVFFDVAPGEETVTNDAFGYVAVILQDILINNSFTRDSAVDSYILSDHPDQYINTNLVSDSAVLGDTQNDGVAVQLINLLRFAFNSNYNPAKKATDVDAFLMNDATILRNLTVQGHGGFMCVLDPEGQILTKSPYIQTGSSFSQSLNRQAFRGGMLVDAFCANTPLTVTNVNNPFSIDVKGDAGSGLALRKPQTPAPFYINGIRYQVNDVISYDPDAAEPIATLLLDETSGPEATDGSNNGWTIALPPGGYDITLQTAGNRSMLGNDFTQINDLGYGLLVMNGGLSEMVSMFTYYCHAAYYAYNGSQIRSIAGSNANGIYGLVAEGADPNEVPDDVVLRNDMVQAARTFSAELVLEFDTNLTSISAGDTIEQTGQTGSAVAVYDAGGKKLYLKDLSGTFVANGGDLVVNSATQTGVVPTGVDTTNYSNPVERLSLYFYDTEFVPTSNGELDYLHNDDFGGTVTPPGSIARYEIANIELVDGIVVDGYTIDESEYTYTAVSRNAGESNGTGAQFVISKNQKNGGSYKVSIFDENIGTSYKVGDTFSVAGSRLFGTNILNDAIITVEEVNVSLADQQAGIETGSIKNLSVSGDPNIIAGLTPERNGQVYKANFSTSGDDFDTDGLLAEVPENQPVMIRSNRNFIFDEVNSVNDLTIRPSTAINFNEDSDFVYRSISFGRANSVGTELEESQTLTGFDTTYDYVRLIVNDAQKTVAGSSISPTVPSTTLGATTGDTAIAVNSIIERRDIYRLNNNSLTDSDNRPPFADSAGNTLLYTNELPMVLTWQGKKHYVFNYREVDGSGNQTSDFDASANSYALVDLKEISEVVLTVNTPTSFERKIEVSTNDVDDVLVRQQNNVGANGRIKISGEQTTEIKLFEAVGNFSVNGNLEISYDNGNTWIVLDGTDPLDNEFGNPVEIVDVSTRDTNLTTQTLGLSEPLSVTANQAIALRAGLQDGAPATITIQISTCRATGHDFLDIGTGSFNETNYPNVVLGFPAQTPKQENEVQELNKGRVFYVSTDQDGFFRVGRFFTVDQGTGTVTFAASIALSDVDGIGFKRGVVVTEFSTDSAMSDNAIDTVPTESAVRGYVNRRLGFDQAGNAVGNPIGPSVIASNGSVPMTGNLNLSGNKITNLPPVDLETTDPREAVPREYVDSRAEAYNKISDQRDVELETAAGDQFIGISGVKTLYLDANSVTQAFEIGDVLTDSSAGADYGTIIGVRDRYDENLGDVNIVSFTPGDDEFTEVDPFAASAPLIYHKTSVGTSSINGQAGVKNGPFYEVINMSEDTNSDIALTVNRPNNDDEDTPDVLPDEPTATYDLQINPEVIVNADVNPAAGIVQSKLDMEFADTYDVTSGDALPTTEDDATVQSSLGLARFDAENFDSVRGYISIGSNGIKLANIQQISSDTVIANSTSSTATPNEVTFNNVVDQGFGIQHSDFSYTDSNETEDGANVSSAGALTRLGNDDYTVLPITTSGQKNSIVKTENNGQITAESIAIGQNNDYTILSATGTSGTELTVSTPGQGTVLTAEGTSNPKVNIPGNLDVGGTGVNESTLQNASGGAGLDGESWIAADWMYTQFIEAANERGSASTGIAIGSGSGKAASGEVAIVVAKTSNNTSPVPFTFSETGVVPDSNGIYNIGSGSSRYSTVYADELNLSAGEGLEIKDGGNSRSGFSNNDFRLINLRDNNPQTDGVLVFSYDVSSPSDAAGNILSLSRSNIKAHQNIVPSSNNSINIGSSSVKFNTVYATIFDGTATSARYADLAENYLADAEYQPGTVLVLGGAEEVTVTEKKDDRRVAGVVTTNPAHLMNSHLKGDFVTGVALQGRVPCHAIGRVEKGDILVTSAIPGYACVNNNPQPGTIIGKAVSEKTNTERGTVEVLVGKS